jgi:hypothetical protein
MEKLIPKTDIQFDIVFNEDYQFIEQPQEIELTNDWCVSLVFSSEVDVTVNRGRNHCEEDEYTTNLINPSVDILEVWNSEDDLVFLSAEQEKQLKRELLNNI